jgi:hypothetical protein
MFVNTLTKNALNPCPRRLFPRHLERPLFQLRATSDNQPNKGAPGGIAVGFWC